MRIISWNCCDGFERKFGHLERLAPDIAIVCEVRPECLRSATLTTRSVWRGDAGQKGLAVICYGDWRVVGMGPQIAEKWFIPLVLSNGIRTVQIVAAWLHPNPDYVSPTKTALQTLKTFIASGPTIIAGDFNQSVSMDKKAGKGRRFAEVLDELREMGLASAWHAHTGEEHGQESSATLYRRWAESSKFHIDFVFYPPQALTISSATLGTFDQYVAPRISDHAPPCVEFL